MGKNDTAKRRDLSLSGSRSRVQFSESLVDTVPAIPPQRCPCARATPLPIPTDPIPDSDEEGQDATATLTPRSAERLGLSRQRVGDAKWWHVPDTKLEELVQTMEDTIAGPG